MKDAVFITGNAKKAEYLSKYLDYPVDHIKIELEEIQSLDLKEVVKHKLLQAYSKVNRPVLVEDVSLEFKALGTLPGTFIRWFMDALTQEQLCSLLTNKDRSAIARCIFGYYDGVEERYFEGTIPGTISEKPAGVGGFGWDSIFIPEGYSVTRAEMNEKDDKETYLKCKPFDKIKEFLTED